MVRVRSGLLVLEIPREFGCAELELALEIDVARFIAVSLLRRERATIGAGQDRRPGEMMGGSTGERRGRRTKDRRPKGRRRRTEPDDEGRGPKAERRSTSRSEQGCGSGFLLIMLGGWINTWGSLRDCYVARWLAG
jgi:hypothetical protein